MYSLPRFTLMQSFFDTLSIDALEHVARHVSSRPSRDDWKSFIKAQDVTALLCNITALSTASRSILTSFNMNYYQRLDYTNDIFMTDPKGRCYLPEILDAAEDSIQSLKISDLPRSLRLNDSWILSLANVSSSLDTLDISGIAENAMIDNVLEACRGRIRALRVFCRGDGKVVQSVAAHCSGLLSLRIVDAPDALEELWDTVGSTLLHLDFLVWSKSESVSPTFTNVRENCTSLTKIMFRGVPRELLGDLSQLYMSYGERLVSAGIQDLDVDMCTSVVHSCPNAVFDCEFDTMALEKAEAIGSRLRSLSLPLAHIDLPPLHAFEDKIRDCCGIRELTIAEVGGLSACHLRALLQVCRESLTFLRYLASAEGSFDFFKIIAANTGFLRKLHYCGPLPDESETLMVACANICMQRVYLYLRPSKAHPRDDLKEHAGKAKAFAGTVRSFSDCRALSELRIVERMAQCIPFTDVIAEACQAYRVRQVYIEVSDVIYRR